MPDWVASVLARLPNFQKEKHGQFLKMAESGDSCCESQTNSCCDDSNPPDGIHMPTTSGKITIDGQLIEFNQDDKNIIDAVSRARIAIPAACYRAQRKKGCCHGCVVEIDGEQNFACTTVP